MALRLLYDIETDGLEDAVTVVHCIVTANLDSFALRAYVQPEHVEAVRAAIRGELDPNDLDYFPIPCELLPELELVGTVEEGLAYIGSADYVAGHNILGYDNPVIDKLHPEAIPWDEKRLVDTLVVSKLLFSNIKDSDQQRVKDGTMPGSLMFRPHSLEAWGYRLGCNKGDYSAEMKAKGLDPWARFNIPQLAYCIQDVILNVRVWKMQRKKRPDPRSVELEMEVAKIILQQERNGFPFDEARAATLYARLSARRQELLDQCAELFPPWWAATAEVVTKKSRRVKRPDLGTILVEKRHKTTGKLLRTVEEPVTEDYVEGTAFTKVRLVTFNPSSRDHVSDRFIRLYGWQPREYGQDGKPTLNDEILSALTYPPAALLAEYYLVEKRIGALAEGKQAWLKKAKTGRDGLARLHGRCNPNGAVSGRATHSEPNLANVPSVKNKDGLVPYGRDCRELFTTVSGFVLVGCDASGLELRALGAALAPYDGGAYLREVVSGDVHTVNQKAADLATREQAKTFIYALLYGSGGYLLGCIPGLVSLEERNTLLAKAKKSDLKKAQRHLEYLGVPITKKNIALTLKGEKAKAAFFAKTPALKKLVAALEAEFKETGTLVGLDGRILHARSKHSLLNLRLQSDGALICKRWMVEMHREFRKRGWVNGRDFMQSAWVHDEVQIQARPEIADELGKIAVECVSRAGVYFDYACPLTGEYKVGANWAETH